METTLPSLFTIFASGTITIPKDGHIGQSITVPIPNLQCTDIIYTAIRQPSFASFIATSIQQAGTADANLDIISGAVGLTDELVISYLILRP